MHIGVCKVTLNIPNATNLKEKRRVIRSLTARLKNKFNLAVAEVGDQDLWQLATLGMVAVSGDIRHVQEMMSHIYQFIQQSAHEYFITHHHEEFISGV